MANLLRQLRIVLKEIWTFGNAEVEALERHTKDLEAQLQKLNELKRMREKLEEEASKIVLQGAVDTAEVVDAIYSLQENKVKRAFLTMEADHMNDLEKKLQELPEALQQALVSDLQKSQLELPQEQETENQVSSRLDRPDPN